LTDQDLEKLIHRALTRVIDPEIRKPITDLDMVGSIAVAPDGAATVGIKLTIIGCPAADTIERDVRNAVASVPGVTSTAVDVTIMSKEERRALTEKLRGTGRVMQFGPDSLTHIFTVTSGKGGVGKSTLTANLAVALAARGLKVGLVDADVFGFSIPGILGIPDAKPTRVGEMILPPIAHEVKVISIGMFVPGNQPVVWRGPMLHRALQQFLGDVFWGDLDVLLLDLPPGTGDIAISVAQRLPSAEILVVTTPQMAAAEVAERAGSIAAQTHQQIAGVIENMAWLPCPHCDDRINVFGEGGGQTVADALTRTLGTRVPLLGQVPIDLRLREGGDEGKPLVLTDPDSPAAAELRQIADRLSKRSSSLKGLQLGLAPNRA
jgi:ATP-binding protein involved in chromosome partitioning